MNGDIIWDGRTRSGKKIKHLSFYLEIALVTISAVAISYLFVKIFTPLW